MTTYLPLDAPDVHHKAQAYVDAMRFAADGSPVDWKHKDGSPKRANGGTILNLFQVMTRTAFIASIAAGEEAAFRWHDAWRHGRHTPLGGDIQRAVWNHYAFGLHQSNVMASMSSDGPDPSAFGEMGFDYAYE